MINNIYTLKEKNAPNFLEAFNEEESYIDDGDLCFDIENGDCDLTVVFENKFELSKPDRSLLFAILRNVVELDSLVANRMSPYKDYEFELSHIEIGENVLFSYCGINVNSTWEFVFNVIQEGEIYNFQSKYSK